MAYQNLTTNNNLFRHTIPRDGNSQRLSVSIDRTCFQYTICITTTMESHIR